jgi:hypothetical protein
LKSKIPDGKPANINASDVEPGFRAYWGHNDKEIRNALICLSLGILIGQDGNNPVQIDRLVEVLNNLIKEKYPFLSKFSNKEVKGLLEKLEPVLRFGDIVAERRLKKF